MSKVLVLYDTRTGNTGRMARADADATILGSPTHNTQPSRVMKSLLSGLSQVPLKGKVGATFGSYGWSGEAAGIMARA